MNQMVVPGWHAKRTAESRQVEEAVRRAGFPNVDAYRHNSASIRVRVSDPRFRGLSTADREAMVDPALANLPEETQADIINLILIDPEELKTSLRASLFNSEFEEGESMF